MVKKYDNKSMGYHSLDQRDNSVYLVIAIQSYSDTHKENFQKVIVLKTV